MSFDPLYDRRKRVVRSRSRFTTLLAFCFFASLIIPNCVLANTEPYSVWSIEALILLPLGLYMMWSVALKRSGIMIWLGFPLIFFGAFQIVLLYLFGNSIIAADMFTNVLSTNPGEAGELLGNIYPAVVIVCVIYLPLLWFATLEIAHKRLISRTSRIIIGMLGAVLFSLGLLALYPAYYSGLEEGEKRHVLRDEVFPLNILYNIHVSATEFRRMQNFATSSEGFTYNAQRTVESPRREIYIYIIGETARAMNWQLYGYNRATNPELSKIDDLVVMRNILTQSNTTHKCVPLLLSSTAPDEHIELYNRKGLPALFKEVGFETWFISNHSPQGGMIDKLAHDADNIIYISGKRYDIQLLEQMQTAISSSKSQKLLFILHSYGSHFSYHQRYPREFAHFMPDDDVAIDVKNKDIITNAYDNSIIYTDHFLAHTIAYLNRLDNTDAAMLFCSDHGEDIIDDERGRFLHASPTTTAYQLYVASLMWFSPSYRQAHPEKVAAAHNNAKAPATNHAMFHTLADMASITGDHIKRSVSLVSSEFNASAPRFYVNDHNEGVPFLRTGLSADDVEVLSSFGVEL